MNLSDIQNNLIALKNTLPHIDTNDQSMLVFFQSLAELFKAIPYFTRSDELYELCFDLSIRPIQWATLQNSLSDEHLSFFFENAFKIQNAYLSRCPELKEREVLAQLSFTLNSYQAKKNHIHFEGTLPILPAPEENHALIAQNNLISIPIERKKFPKPTKNKETLRSDLSQQITKKPNYKEWLNLQQEAYLLVQYKKQNPYYSNIQDMMETIEIALDISSEYIAWLKNYAHLPSQLTSAIKHSIHLLKIYDTYYRRTNATDQAKEQFSKSIESIHTSSINIMQFQLYQHITSSEQTQPQEKINAEILKYGQIQNYAARFAGLMYHYQHIIMTPDSTDFNLETQIELLKQTARLNFADLTEQSILPFHETAKYCLRQFIHSLLGSFNDPDFDAIDFIDAPLPKHSHFSSEIHSFVYSTLQSLETRTKLQTILEIYYDSKIKWLNITLRNHNLTPDFFQFTQGELFISDFRKQSYEYLLLNDFESIDDEFYTNCDHIKQSIDYTTPLMDLLASDGLEKSKISSFEEKQEIVLIELPSNDDSTTTTLTPRSPQKYQKKKKQTSLWAFIDKQFETFTTESWKTYATQLNTFIEEKRYPDAFESIDNILENHPDLSCDAFIYKAIIFKEIQNHTEALEALNQAILCQSSSFPTIKSQQSQKISCEKGEIYQKLGYRPLAQDYFEDAKKEAEKHGRKCFKAILESDLKDFNPHFDSQELIDYLLKAKSLIQIDPYDLPSFYECYKKIIIILFTKITSMCENNIDADDKIQTLNQIYRVLIDHADLFCQSQSAPLSLRCAQTCHGLLRFKSSPMLYEQAQQYYEKTKQLSPEQSSNINEHIKDLKSLIKTPRDLNNPRATLEKYQETMRKIGSIIRTINEDIPLHERLLRCKSTTQQHTFFTQISNLLSIIKKSSDRHPQKKVFDTKLHNNKSRLLSELSAHVSTISTECKEKEDLHQLYPLEISYLHKMEDMLHEQTEELDAKIISAISSDLTRELPRQRQRVQEIQDKIKKEDSPAFNPDQTQTLKGFSCNADDYPVPSSMPTQYALAILDLKHHKPWMAFLKLNQCLKNTNKSQKKHVYDLLLLIVAWLIEALQQPECKALCDTPALQNYYIELCKDIASQCRSLLNSIPNASNLLTQPKLKSLLQEFSEKLKDPDQFFENSSEKVSHISYTP